MEPTTENHQLQSDQRFKKLTDHDISQFAHGCTNTCIMSNFIRLFIIRRIVTSTITENRNMITKVKRLALVLQSTTFPDTALEILSRLTNDGIKVYMEKWYNEEEQSSTIQSIFNQIILTELNMQYQKVITMSNSDPHVKYQTMVVNTNDLMCSIFQFLEYDEDFTGDLYHCSLVNSYWLYNSWNPNCIYHLNEKVMTTLLLYDDWYNSDWNRLIHAKSINISDSTVSEFDDDMLSILSMFKHVQHINVSCGDSQVGFIDIITQQWAPKLLTFNMRLLTDEVLYGRCESIKAVLEPIQLDKATYVFIRGFCVWYHVLWTKKCKQLAFIGLGGLNQEWCNFIIDSCDCNGVNSLTIEDIAFKFSNVLRQNSNNNSCKLLSQFANKFQHLRHLRLYFQHFIDPYVLLLWRLFKETSNKYNNNEIEIELELSHLLVQKELTMLLNYTSSNQFSAVAVGMITKLILHINERFTLKNVINCIRYIEWLKIVSEIHCMNTSVGDWESILEFCNGQLESLMVIELVHQSDRVRLSFDAINKILQLNILITRKIFVILDITTDYSPTCNNSNIGNRTSDFGIFCRNVLLLIKNKIPIHISVRFPLMEDVSQFEKHYQIFLSLVSKEMLLKEYEAPDSGKYCLPLSYPVMSLTSTAFHAKNAEMV